MIGIAKVLHIVVAALCIAPAAMAQSDDGLRRDGARPVEAEATNPVGEAVSLDPILKGQFDETEAVPGQALSLRLTVLVPTSLTKPPVWPSLETPNLLVRLPERSTGPTSERIGGQTWSGVTRHYRISPMVPGDFSLPPQEIALEWADPDGGDPLTATLVTEPIVFRGVVPEGAEQLDPFLAATSLTLTQEVTGTPDAMVPGDSVTISVVAKIEGTSPMFLPPLVTVPDLTGLKAYPDEPSLMETNNRGVAGGTRTERVTLVAEGGGGGTWPALELAWFNLASGAVETATTGDIVFSVDGPAAQPLTPPRDPRRIVLIAGGAVLALIALALAWRFSAPALKRLIRTKRAEWRNSERYAWKQVQRALSRKDATQLRTSIEEWRATFGGPDPLVDPAVSSALTSLGNAAYGRHPKNEKSTLWKDIGVALVKARRKKTSSTYSYALPPLNSTGPLP